ncbi:hypothetical protein PRIPAC_98140, partial [Pristionchus pacificus]
MTEFGYICWGYGFLQKSTAVGFWGSLFFGFTVYQTFILLAFYYVYRYVILFNPPWFAWIQRNPWRNWCTFAVSASIVYCGDHLNEVYGIDLYAPNMPGFLAIAYW